MIADPHRESGKRRSKDMPATKEPPRKEPCTESVRITASAREALDRIAVRMGWDVGRTMSAISVHADAKLSEADLFEAKRLHDASSGE